jgi:hypothetical protein
MGHPGGGLDGAANPYYAAALLKVALAMRRRGAGGLDQLVDQVLQDVAVDPRDFRRYLERNGSLLRAVSRRR